MLIRKRRLSRLLVVLLCGILSWMYLYSYTWNRGSLPPREYRDASITSGVTRHVVDHIDTPPTGCPKLCPLRDPVNATASLNIFSNLQTSNRLTDSRVVESTFDQYGPRVYIELPSTGIKGNTNLILPFMHPDAAISIDPKATKVSHTTDGVFTKYNIVSNLSSTLEIIFRTYAQSGILFMIICDTAPTDDLVSYTRDILRHIRSTDVIVFKGDVAKVQPVLTAPTVCCRDNQWKVHTNGHYYTAKHVTLVAAPPIKLPAAPHVTTQEHEPTCHHDDVTTDVVLMTKNRPMQTQAFLESLGSYGRGISTVWVLQAGDDDLILKAYDYAYNCVRSQGVNWKLSVVRQNATAHFGISLRNLFQNIRSKYVILCVDEMIWLREFDATKLACLVNSQPEKIGSVQLRLGDRLRHQTPAMDTERFRQLKFDPELYMYYPRYLKDDFGYVTNVDGTMMRTEAMKGDLSKVFARANHPGTLENVWVRLFTHVRTRQWHVIYRTTRVVNNMSYGDGRIIDRKGVSSESYQLAQKILVNHLKVDIADFVRSYQNKVSATHVQYPLKYTNIDCQS